MLLIFGIRRRGHRMGTVFAICGQCHTPAAQALIRIKTFFTFLLHPAHTSWLKVPIHMHHVRHGRQPYEGAGRRRHAAGTGSGSGSDPACTGRSAANKDPRVRVRNKSEHELAATRESSLVSEGLNIGTFPGVEARGNHQQMRNTWRGRSVGIIIRRMAGLGGTGGWRSVTAFCALLFSALAVACPTSAGATGSSDLSGAVLSSTIPGYEATPLGTTNGPLTQSSLDEFGPAASVLGQQLANGDLTGYLRVWTHTPLNGDAVEIFALQFSNPAEIAGVLSGFASSQHGSQFRVPGVSGANGYASVATTASGTPAKTYSVTFTDGDRVFLVFVLTESGDLTSADAIKVASEQAAHVGGATVPSSSSGSSPEYVAGEIFGAVVLVVIALIVVIAIVRRSRRNGELHHGHPANGSAVGLASPGWPSVSEAAPSLPTRSPIQPGWEPIPGNMNTQAYWDGQAWTARRTWAAGRWGPETLLVHSGGQQEPYSAGMSVAQLPPPPHAYVRGRFGTVRGAAGFGSAATDGSPRVRTGLACDLSAWLWTAGLWVATRNGDDGCDLLPKSERSHRRGTPPGTGTVVEEIFGLAH